MIYLLVYFGIALLVYFAYWIEFLMRFLIDFCSYTSEGMKSIDRFGSMDGKGCHGHSECIFMSILWPIFIWTTIKYIGQTFNGSFYSGLYGNSNFTGYLGIIKKVLISGKEEDFLEQLWRYRKGIHSNEYRSRDGFRVEKLMILIFKRLEELRGINEKKAIVEKINMASSRYIDDSKCLEIDFILRNISKSEFEEKIEKNIVKIS